MVVVFLCAYAVQVTLYAVLYVFYAIHRVPEKTSHFNFRHNFVICWDIFAIFEAFCSGI